MPQRFQSSGVLVVFLVAFGGVLVGGCTGSTVDLCTGGSDPVVVTGLSGVIDGVTPTVEIVQLIPATCEERESTWMFWDDAASAVSLGPEPSEGTLSRVNIDVSDEAIFFRDFNVGVRLDYVGDAVGPELALAWFSTGDDLATVDCSAAPTLTCAARE